jgi:adhesin/invasin
VAFENWFRVSFAKGAAMTRSLLLSVLLAGWFAARETLAHGDGTFRSPVAIPVSDPPTAFAAGDFNRDGKMDLAAATGRGLILIFIQHPLERGSWTQRAPVAVGESSYLVRAADFDRDGVDDLLVADPATSAVYFIGSRGDSTFGPPVRVLGGEAVGGMTLADLNGDGELDLATSSYLSGHVSVLLGKGDGSFGLSATIRLQDSAWAITALDFDGDGKLDLAASEVPGLNMNSVVLFKGRGDGQFDRKGAVNNVCYQTLSAGDFNQDGFGDLVTDCAVLLGQGDGRFTPSSPGVSGSLWPPTVADLNGDGHQDLVFPDGPLQAVLGKGDGSFSPPVTLGIGNGSSSGAILVQDLDLDGNPDLVSVDGAGPAVNVFWGRAGLLPDAPRLYPDAALSRDLAVADLNQDGALDLLLPDSTRPRVQVFLGPWKENPGLPSFTIPVQERLDALAVLDLDGDGLPDLAGTHLTAGDLFLTFLDPAGKVKSEARLRAGSLTRGVKAGFLNGDTLPDLLVPCAGPGRLAVFVNRGGGSFSEAEVVPSVPGCKDAALADLDGDGLLDAAVVSTERVAVHFAKPGGELGEPIYLQADDARRYGGVAAGDLDGDGLPDLLVPEARMVQGVLFFRGRTGRQFADPLSIRVGPAPALLQLADLDGDGRLDLIAASATKPSLSVVLQKGALDFAPPRLYPLGFSPAAIRTADLDQDGALDLVALFSPGSQPFILYGRPAPAAAGSFRRGDVNADGRLDLGDPIAILGRLYHGEAALSCEDAADANDDGLLDLADPVAILSRLFLGGNPLPPPGPACGEDPTPDLLRPCEAACR